MTEVSADRVARGLSRSMAALDGRERDIALAIYRTVAEGEPADPRRIAEAAGHDTEAVEDALSLWPGVFRDDNGGIVGFWGLAQSEMPHRFEVGGVELFAWCAWDTLFMPALINAPARVTSACPTTGEPISLLVTPEGVEDLAPAGALVSMLMPADGFDADVIVNFCHHVHFFASHAAGERWVEDRDGAFLMSVPEAFRLGRLWNEHRFGAGVGV